MSLRSGHGRKRIKRRYILLIGIGLIALLVFAYLGGRWLESQEDQPETRGDPNLRYSGESTIEVDGISYRQRHDLTTILLIGVDKDSTEVSQGSRNGGQADFLRVLVLDSKQKTLYQLAIDRDTMTPITILGVLGNHAGTRTAQISLSHGFGDGKEQSCELTVNAVSNLLLGTKIDYYFALNMDGISDLNDLLGGVTVTLEDDFSHLDPSMTKGATLTLMGEQSEIFVRSRMSMNVGTNEARMQRQQTYISALTDQLAELEKKNKEFVGKMFDELSSYLITNMGRGRMVHEAWSARNYSRPSAVELQGTHSIDADGFMQYLVDEDALRKTVLELFYEPVK